MTFLANLLRERVWDCDQSQPFYPHDRTCSYRAEPHAECLLGECWPSCAGTFIPASTPSQSRSSLMPSEILLQIVKDTGIMGMTCLSLNSEYLALHCLAAKATFPSKKGAYLDDTLRVTFLNLLKEPDAGEVPYVFHLSHISAHQWRSLERTEY